MKKIIFVVLVLFVAGVSFSYATASTGPTSFFISGTVFYDQNGNGLHDSNETGYISSARSCRGGKIVPGTKIKVTAEKGSSRKISYYALNYCGNRTRAPFSGFGVYYNTKTYSIGTKLTLELMPPSGWKSTWPNPIVLANGEAQGYADFAMAEDLPIVQPNILNEAPAAVKNTGNVTENTATSAASAVVSSTAPAPQKKNALHGVGAITAEAHRGLVANFVQSLLAVAGREGGIGQQVRVIAELQNDTKDKTAEEIKIVENRSEVKTFFFGSDFKNLGDLRSQIVQTRNQIAQLTRLADKAENDQDKAELESQIQTLEQEQTNIDNFVTQNEDKFSLFGWVVKLFR